MENDSLPSQAVELLKNETAPIAKTAANIAENTVGPVSKGLGGTLGDLWFLVFGWIGHAADRRRIKYEHDLNEFKDKLECKISEIPDEKKQEPNTQVAMNALDAARFCVEEPELREMFCNLLASASNSDKASKAHPSFASIIRRMSPFDATLLRQLTVTDTHPIANFVLKANTGGTIPVAKNVLALNGRVVDNTIDVAASLDVLQSLGLIYLDHFNFFNDDSKYDPFRNCSNYQSLNASIKAMTNTPYIGTDIERGTVTLTDLGKQFVAVCM